MSNRRTVLAVALVTALLVYGGLVGLELLVSERSPVASEPTVQGTTYHLDRSGRPTVVGEVNNGLTGPITNVTVTVTYLRNGTVIGRSTGQTLRETIPAGETAPFDIRLPNETSVDDYAVSVSYDRGGTVVSSLAIDAEVSHRSQDQVVVVGTVRNTGSRRLTDVRVVGTFYDADRSVLGARTNSPTANGLAPGEQASFELTFRTLGDVPSLARRFQRFEVSATANLST